MPRGLHGRVRTIPLDVNARNKLGLGYLTLGGGYSRRNIVITLYGQVATQGTKALADSCLANFCFAALSRSSRQQQGTI
jgi:hypothetical protein